MPNCDGYFDTHGIQFEPEYQDIAVRQVRADPDLDLTYKKWMILCWFDTTYGQWQGPHFRQYRARAIMTEYLFNSKYATFEQMLDDTI
jgi:hypothetical protein